MATGIAKGRKLAYAQPTTQGKSRDTAFPPAPSAVFALGCRGKPGCLVGEAGFARIRAPSGVNIATRQHMTPNTAAVGVVMVVVVYSYPFGMVPLGWTEYS